MHTFSRPLRALALCVLLAACGGDDDGDGSDGPPSDAALGADSSEILPDAADQTACGTGEEIMYCERTSQICVLQETGPGFIYQCVDLPDGCDATRDCASCSDVCGDPADCVDSETDNTLTCACPECV